MTRGTARHDVVVIGAGLAGLTATRILHRLGYDVVLLERNTVPGGRIRTDTVDGFRLDHGFQLLNPAYPAGRRTFDYGALDLRPFAAGVEGFSDGRRWGLDDPRREPGRLPRTIGAALLGMPAPPWELAAFGAYVASCGTEPVARLRHRTDVSIAAALRQWGVGRRAMERLAVPFLSGVFADVDLGTGRRYADLVLRSFVRGTPSVPSRGMAALPEQLAAALPDGVLRTGAEVTSLRGRDVVTADETLSGRVVVVATEAPVATRLVPGLAVPSMASLTTWYFALDAPPQVGDRRLLLDGSGDRFLCNAAVMTSAAPEYSQSGRALVAATAVGLHADGAAAARTRREAGHLLGVAPLDLEPIGVYPVRNALPRLGARDPLRRPIHVEDGLLVIGDHRRTPSIQGALVSGEHGARAAARYLGQVGTGGST